MAALEDGPHMLRKTVMLFAMVLLLLSPVTAVNISSLEKIQTLTDNHLSPLNPDFIAFIKYHSISGQRRMEIGGHGLGLIPTPFILKNYPNGEAEAECEDDRSNLSSYYHTTMESIKAQASYRLSPLNPDFENYIKERLSGNQQPVDQEGYALGLIPSLIDFNTLSSSENSDTSLMSSSEDKSGLSQDPSSSVTTASPSSRFDLRTTGKLTPVRDQEGCGACWAFSTYGSLESTNLPSTQWDFSENHLKNTHGFDLSACQGGNYQMSTAYLARWSGAVNEASDPYSASSSISFQNEPVVQHIQEVTYLPSRTGPLDNGLTKQMLQQYGALYSQIRWESGYYSKNPATYYYSGSSRPNHAIVIVGWDDSYSKYKFSTIPPGDGAFIVRNSWGEDWGDDGYFYVSYYDSWIGKPSIQYYSEDTDNYDLVYQYDPLGWVISFGTGSDTAYFANIFTATHAEELVATSFYTTTPNSAYQIEVYKDVTSSPIGSTPSIVQTGSISYAGYHTIDLKSPVTLEKGQKFSIVVKLKTPGYNYPVAIEYPYSGYSTLATALAGESWVSNDGIKWSDLSILFQNTNVCLKAFTHITDAQTTPIPTWNPIPVPTTPSTTTDLRPPTVSLTSPAIMSSYSPGSAVPIEWSSKDNVGVVSVAVKYSVDKGKNWVVLVEPAQLSGTYSWTIPEGISGSVMIRVTASDAAGNTGLSSRTITVKSAGSSSRIITTRPLTTTNNTLTLGHIQSSFSESVKTAAEGFSRFDTKTRSIALASARQSALQRAL